MTPFANVKRQAQQLGRAFDLLAIDDAGNAQVDAREVFDADGVGDRFSARHKLRFGRGCRRLEEGIEHVGIHALHEMLERVDPGRQHPGIAPDERTIQAEKLDGDPRRQLRKDRREHDRHCLEPGERGRTDVLKGAALLCIGGGEPLGNKPGLCGIKGLVDPVGPGHDVPDGAREFARLEVRARAIGGLGPLSAERRRITGVAQLAFKDLADEVGGTAGDVYVLAYEIAVDASHEIVRVEVDVFNTRVELGCDVVPQPFGVHADVEIAQRRDASATALGHFFAAHGNESVHIDLVGRLAARELQRGGPEQCVEVDDVLADEVHLLGRACRIDQGVVIEARDRAIGLERGEVAHRRIEPHIEILARRIGDFDAKVGGVARDIPIAKLGLAVVLAKPFAGLGKHFLLQAARAACVFTRGPFLQEFHAARIRQLEEKVV